MTFDKNTKNNKLFSNIYRQIKNPTFTYIFFNKTLSNTVITSTKKFVLYNKGIVFKK